MVSKAERILSSLLTSVETLIKLENYHPAYKPQYINKEVLDNAHLIKQSEVIEGFVKSGMERSTLHMISEGIYVTRNVYGVDNGHGGFEIESMNDKPSIVIFAGPQKAYDTLNVNADLVINSAQVKTNSSFRIKSTSTLVTAGASIEASTMVSLDTKKLITGENSNISSRDVNIWADDGLVSCGKDSQILSKEFNFNRGDLEHFGFAKVIFDSGAQIKTDEYISSPDETYRSLNGQPAQSHISADKLTYKYISLPHEHVQKEKLEIGVLSATKNDVNNIRKMEKDILENLAKNTKTHAKFLNAFAGKNGIGKAA